MRRPTSGRIDRTTVSTSGSSGTYGTSMKNLAVLDPHRISGDAARGIAIVLAGAAIEFPKVVRAGEVRAIEVPLPERTAVVNADAIESVDDAFDIADGVRVRAHETSTTSPGGKSATRATLTRGISFSKPGRGTECQGSDGGGPGPRYN